jgi:hypothetical protein
MEFIDWAKNLEVDTYWQSLYQPGCLDPLNHSPEIRELCVQEVERVLERTDLSDSERGFFSQAQQNYKSTSREVLTEQLKAHIVDIENQYHTDKSGEFARLWPEFGELLWPQKQH